METNEVDDLPRILAEIPSGKDVDLVIIHEGTEESLSARPGP
jgi:hypothetical protein